MLDKMVTFVIWLGDHAESVAHIEPRRLSDKQEVADTY